MKELNKIKYWIFDLDNTLRSQLQMYLENRQKNV